MQPPGIVHPDKRKYLVIAAGPHYDWARLKASFNWHPFVLLQRGSANLKQVLEECSKLAPCTLLVDYDFFVNSDRPPEFSKMVEFGRSISVLVRLREDKPDEVLALLLHLGCMGFLPAGLSVKHLRRAVCAVRSGEIWAPRKLLSVVLQNRFRDPRSLTARETEILMLVAQGLTNQQISESLHITRETVRWNMRMIYGKLGVHDRQGAVLRGLGATLRKPSVPEIYFAETSSQRIN